MSSFIGYYDRFCGGLDKTVRFLVTLLFYSTILLIFFQVISRLFLGFSIVWMMEYVRYVLSLITIWGASCLIYSSEHINVDLLVKRFSPKVRLFLSSLSLITLIYFLSFFVTPGFNYAIAGIDRFSTSGVFSQFIPRIIVPTGAIMLIIQSSNQLLKKLYEFTNWSTLHGQEREQ